MSEIKDTIWITSRVRMIAERKAIRNQNVSYLSVTYYSLFTVVLSLFSNYYENIYPAISQLTLASSIVVLVASLVAAGFRQEARAVAFRECYLKLQRLYDENRPDEDKRLAYREILVDFPNHSPRDYIDFIFSHTILEGKELSNNGKPITPNWFVKTSWLARFVFYYGLLFVLFAGPIVFLIWPLFLFKS